MWEFARPFCKAMCSYLNPLKASQNQTKLGKTIELSNRGLALTTFQQGAESMHRQKKGKRACVIRIEPAKYDPPAFQKWFSTL
jgi:hypothetical protein